MSPPEQRPQRTCSWDHGHANKLQQALKVLGIMLAYSAFPGFQKSNSPAHKACDRQFRFGQGLFGHVLPFLVITSPRCLPKWWLSVSQCHFHLLKSPRETRTQTRALHCTHSSQGWLSLLWPSLITCLSLIHMARAQMVHPSNRSSEISLRMLVHCWVSLCVE